MAVVIPAWLVTVAINTAVTVAVNYISFLLSPTPKGPASGQVGGAPTATAGTNIPVVFGTRVISAPNVVWWGDVAAVEIKEKAGKK